MNRVIERLQLEADVQGGIILDTWSDERHIDRKLMEIKSYAYTFLVQSFLPAQRTVTPRSNSPGTHEGTEDEGVDMKEIDGLLNEMTVMLGRWSLYCRFLAETCNVSSPFRANDPTIIYDPTNITRPATRSKSSNCPSSWKKPRSSRKPETVSSLRSTP